MFMCQRDSFLTEFETEIVSCEEVPDHKKTLEDLGVEEPSSTPYKLYKVVTKDTVLFPEGGGQPDDHGTINEAQVVKVLRNGESAIHYVTTPVKEQNGHLFNPGQKVFQTVDWQRRFDHIQQHSGQHLITAVADNMFKFATTSWWLGKEESYIELDTKEITDAQLKAIEDEVNKKIRENVVVTVNVVELDDEKLKLARGRNLPADVTGNIRIVTMDGIESNVCCGTHVSNLSELQVIKLLYSVKKKGKSYLYFLSGNRVINKFSDMLNREVKLMMSLKVSPKDFVGATDKLNLTIKSSKKNLSTLYKELASIEADRFAKLKSSHGLLWHCHRDNVDVDFAVNFLREIGPADDKVVLVSLKTDGNCGQFWLQGGKDVMNSDLLVKVGEKLSEILDGKGAFRGCMYQAKVCKINKISNAVAAIQPLLSIDI